MGMLAAFAVVLAAGCSPSSSYFPLEDGHSWTYNVRAGLALYVEDVKVVRRVSVAGTTGYELGGPLGFSRVAWKGGVLVADALPNTGVSPPLPLFVPNDPNTISLEEAKKEDPKHPVVRQWRGLVEVLGRKVPAKAVLVQEEATVDLGRGAVPAIKAILRLTRGGKVVELDTWYVDDMGPVRQVQHTDGSQDISMDYLVSP